MRISLYVIIAISVVITICINSFFIKYIKSKDSLLSIFMGFQITIVGLFFFDLVFKTPFYTKYASNVPYFLSTYLITTGLFLSIVGYIKNSK